MRLLFAILFLLVVLSAAGCSRVSVFYNTADFFIEQYADDYLSLDSAQVAPWRPTLDRALARHRQDELPYLAAYFDDLHRAASRGFDAATVECLIDTFEEVYRRHFRLAAGLAAPLLASLKPEQVRALERRFAKDNEEEVKENNERVERRKRKRAVRWAESAEWWAGPLSKQQRGIIRDVTSSMPDTAADWATYRSAKQKGLIRLLDAKADEGEIRAYLTDWLVDHKDLSPPLRAARLDIRRQVVELFTRLDASFTGEQRVHFEDRLADLRDDFLQLQKSPRMAAVQCTRQG